MMTKSKGICDNCEEEAEVTEYRVNGYSIAICEECEEEKIWKQYSRKKTLNF